MNRAGHLALGIMLAGAGCGFMADSPADAGAGDATPDAVVPTVAPDVDGLITINELMTANGATQLDDFGLASDWVELYNPTGHDIPLHGYALTNDFAAPMRGAIGPGVVIPAKGHVLLWLSPGAVGSAYLNVNLDRDGGVLALNRPDGSPIDRLSYAAQEVDFSAARIPDGSDLWTIEWNVTPGASNGAGAGQPMGLALDGAPPEQIPAAGDLSEKFLGYDELPELAIDVSAASAASLEASPRIYVPAQITFEGRSYGPVGLRLKGQNSFEPFSQKPSMRINVDEYRTGAKFFGLKDLTLNNMDNDFSMIHERLAYKVARDAGVPASRANHARITVNGQFYGLYANVETVKKQMMSRWFADDTGPLFEGTDVDFVTTDIPDFDLETGPDDRSTLYNLSAALTLTDATEAIAAASAYVDMPQFLRYWAVCAVIGQFDGLPYSVPGDDFLLYADPASGKLNFIPWGMDETFYSGEFNVGQVSSILAQTCVASPACYQALVDEIWATQTRTEQMGLAAERDRVIAQVAPYVAQDLRKPYTAEQVSAYQDVVYWFIDGRRTSLEGMLPPQ